MYYLQGGGGRELLESTKNSFLDGLRQKRYFEPNAFKKKHVTLNNTPKRLHQVIKLWQDA